jgi:hypothetical protein
LIVRRSRSRARPALAVGLHVVVADAAPALAPGDIPHLVEAGGRLRRSPAAQGVQLAHVDGHHHLHVHPVVLCGIDFEARANFVSHCEQRYAAYEVVFGVADRSDLAFTVDAYRALYAGLIARPGGPGTR